MFRSIRLVIGLGLVLSLTGCQIGGSSQPANVIQDQLDTSFVFISPAFKDNELIPVRFANTGIMQGENISIPLSWENPPPDTKSFALMMVDRSAGDFVHWMVIDIPADVRSLPDGASQHSMPGGSQELINSFNTVGYGGPQPPKSSGIHTYEIDLFALDADTVSLPSTKVSDKEFVAGLTSHVIATAHWRGVMEYTSPF